MKIEEMVESLDKTRISLENVYMRMAVIMAERSTCPTGKKHGAVAVKDGRVVAMGYNGPMAKASHCEECSMVSDIHGKDWRTCPDVHAEENVVANAAKYGTALSGCGLIVTKKPCDRCIGILTNAGICHVLYAKEAL